MGVPADCRVTVFSAQKYDRFFLTRAAMDRGIQFHFLEARLEPDTAVLAQGANAICVFVNDQVDAEVLAALHAQGIAWVYGLPAFLPTPRRLSPNMRWP